MSTQSITPLLVALNNILADKGSMQSEGLICVFKAHSTEKGIEPVLYHSSGESLSGGVFHLPEDIGNRETYRAEILELCFGIKPVPFARPGTQNYSATVSTPEKISSSTDASILNDRDIPMVATDSEVETEEDTLQQKLQAIADYTDSNRISNVMDRASEWFKNLEIKTTFVEACKARIAVLKQQSEQHK